MKATEKSEMRLNQILHTHYQIVKCLGSGAFGQTYLAKNVSLPDTPLCVIKQLKLQTSGAISFETAKALFEREIAILRQLGSHQYIPQIFDDFNVDREFYFVQEYIEGKTLREEFDRKLPWNESQAVQFLKEILKILEFVHRQGVIHRDVKPENIIRRSPDQALFLIDFGAAKQTLAVDQSITSTIVHSRGYSPPEQLAGLPNFNSDIYALGMTTIEGLTNVNPAALPQLRDPETQAIMWAENLEISNQFKRILSKMTCINPRDRYSSTSLVLKNLDALEAKCFVVNSGGNYTPTEITIPDKQVVLHLERTPSYIPTEWGNINADALSSLEAKDSEISLEVHTIPGDSQLQLNNGISPEALFQSLQAQLRSESVSQLRKKVNAIGQLFNHRLIVVSIVLTLASVGLLLYYFMHRKSEFTAPSVLTLDATNNQINEQNRESINFQERSSLKEHTSAVKFLAFTSDGSTLVSVGEGGSVKQRDLAKQTVKPLTQLKSKILAASISANGKILAIATEDKRLEIWDLNHYQKIRQILGTQLTWSLALNRDGSILAGGGLGIIRRWQTIQNPTKGYEDLRFAPQKTEPIQSLAFSTKGILVAGNADGTVKVTNPDIHQTQTFHFHGKAVNAIAFEQNEAILFTGSEDNSIRIWNLYAMKEHILPVIQTDLGGVKTLASSPVNKIIAAGGSDGMVQLWDWQTGQSVANYAFATEVTTLAFSPDGRMLAVGDQEGSISIYISR